MIALPLPPKNANIDDLSRWADQLVRALNAALDQITQPATGRDASGVPIYYQPTAATARRTLDTSTATLTQVSDFVCTLAADLKKRGDIL